MQKRVIALHPAQRGAAKRLPCVEQQRTCARRALAGESRGDREAHTVVQAEPLDGRAAAQLEGHALDVHALWLRQLPAPHHFPWSTNMRKDWRADRHEKRLVSRA